jgi:hypothetical protein
LYVGTVAVPFLLVEGKLEGPGTGHIVMASGLWHAISQQYLVEVLVATFDFPCRAGTYDCWLLCMQQAGGTGPACRGLNIAVM